MEKVGSRGCCAPLIPLFPVQKVIDVPWVEQVGGSQHLTDCPGYVPCSAGGADDDTGRVDE